MRRDPWRALAKDIVAAREVRLFGVVPRPLLEALRAELMQRRRANVAIDYYTPSPDMSMSAIVEHRWQLGHMGIRNIGRGASGRAEHDVQSTLYSFPCAFYDCFAVTRGRRRQPSVRFLWTPRARDGDHPQPFMLSPDRTETKAIMQRLELIVQGAPSLRLGEVVCSPTAEHGGQLGSDLTRFAIAGARAYGDADAAEPLMRPIAVIVAYAQDPDGKRMLLKERTPLIDAGDFGDICLLGTRVQLRDVANAYEVPVPEPEDYQQIWLKTNQQRPFAIPKRAFELAAKRELYITCGRTVCESRLGLVGTYVVGAAANEQLGVAVFALDLRRDDTVDELTASMRSAPPRTLFAVPMRDLYRDESRRLNRFLVEAQVWLTDQVLDAYGSSATERSSEA